MLLYYFAFKLGNVCLIVLSPVYDTNTLMYLFEGYLLYKYSYWLFLLQKGDRVIAFTDYGAWGELVVAPAKYVFKMPSNMSYQDGAALPMNFLSAYIMLFDIGNLQKGMSVFAHNIGGGVVSLEFVLLYSDLIMFVYLKFKDVIYNVWYYLYFSPWQQQ